MPHIFSYCFSPCSPFPRFGVKLLKKYLKPQSSFCSSNQTPPPPKKKIAMVVHQLYKPHSQLFLMLKVCEKSPFVGTSFFLDVSLDLSCGLVAWSWISSIGCVFIDAKLSERSSGWWWWHLLHQSSVKFDKQNKYLPSPLCKKLSESICLDLQFKRSSSMNSYEFASKQISKSYVSNLI